MKTTMRAIVPIIPLTVAVGALLGACGKTQEPPARDTRVLGGTPHGAPVDVGPADPGILQDQGQYRPASFAGESGRAERSGPAAGADAVAAARELVERLLGHIASGEVELALGLIDAEQVRPLLEDTEFLHRTFEVLELLSRGLEKVAGAAVADRLAADVRPELAQDLAEALKAIEDSPQDLIASPMEKALAEAMKDFLKIDPVDADTAVVSPNVLAMLLGPAASETLTVARRNGQWRVRLDRALTAADVAEIRAFHQQYQEAMNAAIEAMERGEMDLMKLMGIMAKFGRAIPDVGLPGAGERKADEQEGESP